MDYPVSDELRDRLHRQIMRGATVGAVSPHGMKWANDLIDRGEEIEEDHSPSGGEELRPKSTPRLMRIIRARPFLALIDCGR